MSSGKLIVVVGATGNQGGSVVNTFLSEPGWSVRGLTRNTSSAKAQDLASRGIEVVSANIDDPDYWGLLGDPANENKPKQGQPINIWAAEHETEQLKNIIDAAAKFSTLERLVLSSLSNATKNSKGKYTHVYHFDSKGKAKDYEREHYPDLWAKTSIFQAGFFLSNFVNNPMMQPVMGEQDIVQFINSLDPDKKIPFIAAEEDTGPVIKALVQGPAGQNVIGYRGWISLREIVDIFTKVTKLPSEAVKLPKGQLRAEFPLDLKIQLDDNWAYLNDYRYEGEDGTIIHPKDLSSAPELDTVFSYVKKQNWEKVLGLV
ncbi:hypothetical protein GGI35DRAFT_482413 [Trichoderma velutinum]